MKYMWIYFLIDPNTTMPYMDNQDVAFGVLIYNNCFVVSLHK